MRALGSGRVLDDVLSLVLDSAIDVGGAERGFIMLANPTTASSSSKWLGREDESTLSGGSFETSRKIPEEVFRNGEAKIVADLLDSGIVNLHGNGRARDSQCLVRAAPAGSLSRQGRSGRRPRDKRIGVLYLDSREKGTLLSSSTRAALETLATEAAVAIENARLYRETMEKAKMEQEMRIAAEIEQALLPKMSRAGTFFTRRGASIPCRSIGGDFYDYVDLPTGALGFALGDVAGRGLLRRS